MCFTVVINNGEKEIETPRQFEEYFGYLPIIEKHFKDFEWDGMQYNITI